LRRHEEEFRGKGAEIVAVGTGDARYARAFIDDEEIDFPVLLDEEGVAAEMAELKTGGWFQLAGPKTAAGVLKATAAGACTFADPKAITRPTPPAALRSR
jgi:peroxiredoxin